MMRVASITAILASLALAGALSACSEAPSPPPHRSVQPSTPQVEEASAPELPVDGQMQQSSGSQESIPAGETAGSPEEMVLNLLARLGYDRSTLFIAQSRLRGEGPTLAWEIDVSQGADQFAYGIVPDGSIAVDLIKFVQPSDSSSPAATRPGPDLPKRVAEALGLPDQGYVPVTWLPDMYPKEYRKYAPFREYQVCTHRVIIATDFESDGLKALMFGGGDINSISKIPVDRETAIDQATGNGEGARPDATHVDLVFLLDRSAFDPSPVLYWEVSLSDGAVKYVNCQDGSVMPYQPGI